MSENKSKPTLRIIFGLAILSLIFLAACAQEAPTAPAPREAVVEKEVVREAPAEAPLPSGADPGGLSSFAERMIIRTAELAIVVEDTETILAQIRGVAVALDGYVADTNIWRADERLRGTVTIRVPAESFDAAMDQIKDLAVEVERENISAQDVTEEYTDLSARLRNLEATEEELLVLMTEVREKTREAEDVLAIHRELTNIRGQIEQVKGRMQFLERMTGLATINVELIPEEEEKPIVEEGWQPLRTLRGASRALVNTGQFLVDAAIWLIVFVLPVLLVLLSPLVVLRFVWRRWRRGRAAKEDSPPKGEDSE